MTVAEVVARYNPRYVVYAKAHDQEPSGMLEVDRIRYPGGHMAGFMRWIQHRWAEYREHHGLDRNAAVSERDHADFTAWLERQASDPCAQIRLRD